MSQEKRRHELDPATFQKQYGDESKQTEHPFPKIPELETWYYSLQDTYMSDGHKKLGKSTLKASYVLRNHTKKVFVLETPFCTSFTDYLLKMSDTRWPSKITMTQAVLSQCCLSANQSDTMDGGSSDEIVGGPWAGDESDLVTEREFLMAFRRGEEDAEQWKNDGERVFKQMWRIVEVEAPPAIVYKDGGNSADYRDSNEEEPVIEPTPREVLVSLNHPGKTVQDLLHESEVRGRQVEEGADIV